MGKIMTLRINDKLIILDGVGPLRYLDLKTNTVTVFRLKKPYKVRYKVRYEDLEANL